MTKEEILFDGEWLFQLAQMYNPCNPDKEVAKITSIEEWTSTHDDSAIFIKLLDSDGKTLWETDYDVIYGNYSGAKADALTGYLQEKFHCPVEKKWFGP